MSNKDFLEKINELVGNEYTFLEKYVNTKTKIKVKHNICGNEYEVTPSNFIKGRRCPFCCKKNTKRTNKEFKEEIFNLVRNEYIFLEDYINTDTKIKVKHNICGNEYKVTPKEFIHNNSRCPICWKKTKESFAIKEIKKFLIKNNIKFIDEYKINEFDINKRFDLYLPTYNLIIEYDGIQHFIPKFNYNDNSIEFKKQLKRDLLKNYFISSYSNINNYSLLRIRYDMSIKNIKEFLTNFLLKENSSTTINDKNIFYIKNKNIYNHDEYYSKLYSLYNLSELEMEIIQNNLDKDIVSTSIEI
jgi:very-short-patch-repair endonuclease